MVEEKNRQRSGYGLVRFTEVYMTDWEGKETIVHQTGGGFKVYMVYESQKQNLEGTFCFLIYRDDGLYCYGTNTFIEQQKIMKIEKQGIVQVEFSDICLLPVKYYFEIAIHDTEAVNYDYVGHLSEFYVMSNKEDQGVCRIKNKWSLEKIN